MVPGFCKAVRERTSRGRGIAQRGNPDSLGSYGSNQQCCLWSQRPPDRAQHQEELGLIQAKYWGLWVSYGHLPLYYIEGHQSDSSCHSHSHQSLPPSRFRGYTGCRAGGMGVGGHWQQIFPNLDFPIHENLHQLVAWQFYLLLILKCFWQTIFEIYSHTHITKIISAVDNKNNTGNIK